MPSRSDPPATPASVLVYTYEDTLGDGLVKLPFLRELRRRLPEARLTWCAGVGPTAYAGALRPLAAGLLDEAMGTAGIGVHAFELLGPARPLGGRRFDLVLDTQTVLLRSLCVRRVAHGLFISAAAGFRLSHRRPAPGVARPRHLVDGLIGLLDLAVPGDSGTAEAPLPIPETLRAAARGLLPEGPLYVGLAPGAGDKAKIWPLPGFIALARAQAAKGRVPVFFLGPDEQALLEPLKAEVPGARFPEWEGEAARGPVFAIALAERVGVAVANDSGAGHMLAAGGAALVSLFSKHDPAKYAPRASRLRIVDSKAYGGTDPALIPVSAVEEALEALIRGEA